MLKAISVEKINEHAFMLSLSDGSYVVVSAEDMATLLLSRKGKTSIRIGATSPSSDTGRDSTH